MFDFTDRVSTRLRRLTPQGDRHGPTAPATTGAQLGARSADHWMQLDRFLALGAEGGTLYVGEHPLTQATARAVKACLAEDGVRVVHRATETVEHGASRNESALFVLALAAGLGNEATRVEALASLDRMARAETNLFDWLLRRLS
jgi:60 kDa SS-A/Ro ribonucleoprotein